jgi:hypothetical protein
MQGAGPVSFPERRSFSHLFSFGKVHVTKKVVITTNDNINSNSLDLGTAFYKKLLTNVKNNIIIGMKGVLSHEKNINIKACRNG